MSLLDTESFLDIKKCYFLDSSSADLSRSADARTSYAGVREIKKFFYQLISFFRYQLSTIASVTNNVSVLISHQSRSKKYDIKCNLFNVPHTNLEPKRLNDVNIQSYKAHKAYKAYKANKAFQGVSGITKLTKKFTVFSLESESMKWKTKKEITTNLITGPSHRNFKSLKILKLSYRQRTLLLRYRLLRSSDVHLNPGPDRNDGGDLGGNHLQRAGGTTAALASTLVTTYNVRGLKDENKLRHLLNHFNRKIGNKNMDTIVCLQETYLELPGKIPYLWRGNFHLTPGVGNSGGCLSLLSSHICVVAKRNLGHRGHVLACQRSDDTAVSFILVNIYAPNPNNSEKVEYYNEVFDVLGEFEETHHCSNIVVAGDFNLVFAPHETKNRLHSAQEKRVASIVKNLVEGAGLTDIWDGNKRGFTWKRANSDTFSTIDRILYQSSYLSPICINEDWSLSLSDHAAVEVGFKTLHKDTSRRSKIPRIDPSLAKDPAISKKLFDGVIEMLATMPQGWDPHMKLEFSKVCIRTVAERLQAERKRREKMEEDILNDELNETITVLETDGLSVDRTNALIIKAEELRARKSALVEEKGKRLAERLGTKWYQEGEKSSRYFMRLLNRPTPDDFKSILKDDGTTAEKPEEISKEIGDFYRKLYENFDEIETTEDDVDDFFSNISPISEENEREIIKPITADELRRTLQTCQDSAPGPDGIPYSIIGLLWPAFGSILTDAWNHSLANGRLSTSHRQSYLKLIPKTGKDLRRLTNWRPITLSNCDHKLITKTYSKRMCDRLAERIEERQTAYLKGRLINDNIRSIIATINITNSEELSGLLVALDAKKAFDSVSHAYIERCLKSFGCSNFIPIFRTLYSDLNTDIIINGRVEKGFRIKRGVKQGDALSCIIFIMCMEPLLRNIENNPAIEPIVSRTLNEALPKTYAYADDVNATIHDNPQGLQELFKEYERLSRNSGLELNADKTEIMRLGSDARRTYQVSYLGNNFVIKTLTKLKINGILFQTDTKEMEQDNVDAVCGKIEAQFRRWSKRNLSTLGKVLIVKTFGISQIIFVMQSLTISDVNVKKLNALLYKFIWNKNFYAAKAPERIERLITNKPIKLGGLGMINIRELDDSLKLRALGRLLETNHPFLRMLKNRTNIEQFFDPKIEVKIEGVSQKGIELLKEDRSKLWGRDKVINSVKFLRSVRETDLKLVVSEAGTRSIQFFTVWRRGARKIKDLTLNDLAALQRHVSPEKIITIRQAIGIRLAAATPEDLVTYYLTGNSKSIVKCSSKEFRLGRSNSEPIKTFKIGMTLTKSEALSWGLKLSKIKSTAHKNITLRVAHGEIYTKEKLFRFGLAPDPKCPRCNEIETLRHKFIECDYVKRIWNQTFKCIKEVTLIDPTIEDRTQAALGTYLNSDCAIMTLNAEILSRIHSLKDTNYTVHPKFIVKSAARAVERKEKAGKCKEMLKSIYERLQ